MADPTAKDQTPPVETQAATAQSGANVPSGASVPPEVQPSKQAAPDNSNKRLDEGPEGGQYLVGGVLVNCNGDPIKGA